MLTGIEIGVLPLFLLLDLGQQLHFLLIRQLLTVDALVLVLDRLDLLGILGSLLALHCRFGGP